MCKILLGALALILTLTLAAEPARAHGGQYKGPADAAPGGPGSGGNVGPPTNPGGSATAAPGEASSGDASTTGSDGRSDKRRGKRRAPRTGPTLDTRVNYEIWEFWWENNKDAFRNRKDRLRRSTRVSGGVGQLSGRGRKADARSSRQPSRSLVNSDIIPPLQNLLKQAEDRNILDSAVLALGRAAAADMATTVLSSARPLLSHPELSVQSASALALGVLGANVSLPVLHDLMSDSSRGRQLAGGGEIHWLVRAFAALSLGLIDEEQSVASLTDLIEQLPDSERDIKVCAIVALGLMQNSDKARAAEYLLEKLDDRRLDAVIKSYIPTSLGKLGYAPAVEKLLAVFRDRDTDHYVRQSAAIALGRLGSMSQPEVVASLLDYIAEGRDAQTRHFAFISLAKIGARDEQPEQHAEAHAALVKRFLREISKPDRRTNRSWAALASAIYMRTHTRQDYMVTERLAEAYAKESDPSYQAAFAVAMGLLDHKAMGETLYTDFRESRNHDFRGYAAVALGLMNHRQAAQDLRKACAARSSPATFRLQVATGLGLMGDTQAVGLLIGTLDQAQTLGVSSAVAKALGLIGDKAAISPLKDIATDPSKRAMARAFACVALGLLGEKTDLPWNAAISADNNYRARVPAIDEILDIL